MSDRRGEACGVSGDQVRSAVWAHYQAVRAYLLRRIDPETAQDALAETFLVAWRRLDARRTLANQRRSISRASALATRLAAQPSAPGSDDELANQRAAAETVPAALGRLTEADRETLRLVAWEGLEPGRPRNRWGAAVPPSQCASTARADDSRLSSDVTSPRQR